MGDIRLDAGIELAERIERLDRAGALFPLPGVAPGDRDRRARGFALLLRNVRFELLRQREYAALDRLLERMAARARVIGDHDLAELARLLLRHNRWLTGRFEHTDDLLAGAASSGTWAALDDVFSSFYANTLGWFSESMRRLRRVEQASAAQRRAAEFFVGLDLRLACAAWKFWNRGELSDYAGMHTDSGFLDDVCGRRYPGAGQSRAQLLLAAGTFYLHHRNYALADRYLTGSFEASSGTGSRLYPRIASALALCRHHQGDAPASAAYFTAASAGLPEHFGPTGWQLRLVAYQRMLGDTEGALGHARRIRAETEAKHEVVHNIWARIYELDLLNELHTSSVAAWRLLDEAASRQMSRACAFIVERQRLAPA
ncbi:hypothetical protein [Nocardia sp. NPDC052566]|uniref:hypothetical protein n=1 Tax=Nocardia sp. NPDC052566 TaxID=3364330 RepID=UPI0037C9C5D2